MFLKDYNADDYTEQELLQLFFDNDLKELVEEGVFKNSDDFDLIKTKEIHRIMEDY